MRGEGSPQWPFTFIAGSGGKRSAGGGRSGQRRLPGQVNPSGGEDEEVEVAVGAAAASFHSPGWGR